MLLGSLTDSASTPQVGRANVQRAGAAWRLAGILGLLCILGCAAGPPAIGGNAAVTGAL